MKAIVPDYYKTFKCIADKCKHSCCIGWEIDIDEDALSLYENTDNPFKKRLAEGIRYGEDCTCFKLDGKGRCAFLNESNLCEIILNMGESSLCQICADHPRFRNYYSDRVEAGLGLCCEEAGRIILSAEKPFALEIIDDDNENTTPEDNEAKFFNFRDELFGKIYQGTSILSFCESSFPEKSISQWAELYLSLERLDDQWTVVMNDLKNTDVENIEISTDFNMAFHNLICYFVYRHLNEFFTEADLMFIHLSCEIIKALCRMHIRKYEVLHLNNIVEYARMYSSEIEYSDENIEIILQELSQQ